MKFLVDAQLPPGLCRWLQARGHEAEHVFGLDMHEASDAAVAAIAAETGAALISKDEDFVVLSGRGTVRLLWLRCGNISNAALEPWLAARWPQIEALLEAGEDLIEVI
jgi:predicted nuclease of predicted toxin-antitoxin system